MLRILIIALAAAVASAGIAAASEYEWPLCNGGEYTAFGYRVDSLSGRVEFHTGADIGGNFGDTVQASRAGKVVAAERRGPYGLMIEIDHGGEQRTRYAQLARIIVKPGQDVAQGQKIGEVGATGRAAGPHLHFEIWRNNVARDPMQTLPPNPACSRRVDKLEQRAAEPQPAQTRKPTFEELNATRFAWPLCGRRGDNFGYRYDTHGEIQFHAGLDLGMEEGLPVRAAAAGRVLTAEESGPYGLLIEMDHGRGFRTRYGHLGSFRVRPGQVVGRGQVIGTVGNTGKTTGPLLHFEIWLMDVIRPPLLFLERESTCANWKPKGRLKSPKR